MFCLNCRTENPVGAVRCAACGAPLAATSAESVSDMAQAQQGPQAYPAYPAYPPNAGYPGSYPNAVYGAPMSAPQSPYPYPPMGAPGPYSQPAPGAPGSYPTAYPSTPLYPSYPAYPYPYAAPATRPIAPDEALSGVAPMGKRMGPLGKARELLVSRLPWWGAMLALAVPLLLVGIVYAVATLPLGDDWARGAQIAGIAALGLAGVALLIALLRMILGRRTLASVGLSLALIILLGALGSGGLLGGKPLHLAQAQQLERSGQWSAAIGEYALAGQNTPTSGNIARVYDEWGESELQQRDYLNAAAHFNTVLSDYNGSGVYALRAERDLFQTYSAWITSGRTDVDYTHALLFLDSYRVTAQCDSSCRSNVSAIETQGYYQYGVALAARGDYLDAVTQFTSAQSLLPGSHFAQLAYQAAAPAYYNLGQQQLSSGDCAGAVASYQSLVANYKGTQQATQAGQALAAPVQVTGDFFNYIPTSYIPTVYLSKTAHAPASQNAAPGSFYFSQDYGTNLGSGGAYTFTGVTPGNYTLSVVGANSTSWWLNNDGSLYFFPVSPLCGAQVKGLDGGLIS